MESVNILIDYFNMFKLSLLENSSTDNKKVDATLKILNNFKNGTEKVQYLTDFDSIVELVRKCDLSNVLDNYYDNKDSKIYSLIKDSVEKGIDSVIYDVIYNVIKYNNYISNKYEKSLDLTLDADISFENLDVNLKDVLNYLDVKEGDLDKDLIDDLSKYADINKLKDFSIAIKTDNGLRRVLFDKIEDKNVLVSILLHSNLEIVDNIVSIFANEKANLNKVVNNIPSIFIKDMINSKCKYNSILTNYNNFVNNYKFIKDSGLDFKKMLNQCVFFLNDVEKNMDIVNKLDSAVN